MAAEERERWPVLRERLHKPGFKYFERPGGLVRVPYKEIPAPGSTPTVILGGFCEIKDPNRMEYTDVLEGFAERGRWPIRLAEPIGKVVSFDDSLNLKFAIDDVAEFVAFIDQEIPPGKKIELIGISQGGMKAMQVALARPHRFNHVGLFVPGGLMNGAVEPEDEKDKKLEFLDRTRGWFAESRKSAKQKMREQGPLAVIDEGARFLGHVFSDPIRAAARAREVIDADMIPEIAYLRDNYGILFTIGAGEQDELFPKETIETNLTKRGVIFPEQPSNPRLFPIKSGHDLIVIGRGFANLAIDAMEETERLAA